MRVLAPGEVANARHVDLLVTIAVPVGFGDHIRVVRMSQRSDQAERASIPAAGEVEQLLTCRGHYIVVKVDLVRARAGAGLGYGIHGVIPPGALRKTRPIRGP